MRFQVVEMVVLVVVEVVFYRGTRRVQGEYAKFVCAQTAPTTGVWINAFPGGGGGSFTTYELPEIGSVNCAQTEPADTLRRTAQIRLSC
ncbi:hypothetical protein ACFVTF_03440 [Kitasatospora sp. NPDC057940]|uniref:hypothetical protein n=1 Tax=Kitasatospora sp. NPDC057940 TaxID=3346285 RepID=UPI0036DBAFBD